MKYKRYTDCGEIYLPTMIHEKLLRIGIKDNETITEEKYNVIYKKDGTIILKPIKTI